jgi:tripartite-type tricarboxylate transporter receptor subunit TctC
MNKRRFSATFAALAFACTGVHSVSAAQPLSYPTHVIKMVVPYPPGGGSDITARVIAKSMADFLGQPVIIENKPGATGMIGAKSVVSSLPDGYTVLFGAASEMAINASLFRKMTYDPRTDLEPVSLIATFPLILVTSSKESLEKLVERARRSPNTVTYGSIGAGSPQHLAGAMLEAVTNTKLVHVPYKGSGPLMTDVLGGHVDIAFSSLPAAVQMIDSGRVRALAVTSGKRSSAVQNVPAMTELGYGDYELSTWVGVAVPAGTPGPIINKLNDALIKALATKEVQASLVSQGAQGEGTSPEQFRKFILNEIAKSDRIVARAKIQLD